MPTKHSSFHKQNKTTKQSQMNKNQQERKSKKVKDWSNHQPHESNPTQISKEHLSTKTKD